MKPQKQPHNFVEDDLIEVYYSEIVDSLESGKKFCKLNKIKPEMVVVVWKEKESRRFKK